VSRTILPALALAVALLAGFANSGRAADDKPVSVTMTKGSELTPEEDKAIRATLTHYLTALQKKDWAEAAKDLDRDSFLEVVDPLIASLGSDSSTIPVATRNVFGVSTKDSMRTTPMEVLFSNMMNYVTSLDPNGVGLMAKAKFALLGARKLQDKVHIAYSLTIPAESDTLQPYTRVTAEQMKQVGKDWKIIFRFGG